MSFSSIWEHFKRHSIRLTQPHKRSKFRRYAFPIILLSFLFIIDYIIGDFRQATPLLLLTFIIILSAWYGGLGPGILATFLAGATSDYFFLSPKFSFTGIEGVIATITFILQGIVISFISEAKRQADVQKNDFIGFASHELKNPLATIQGYSQMLQKMSTKLRPKRISEIGVTLENQTKRATMLINELLDVTKIESGKLSYHEEKFLIYDLVKSIVEDQKIIHSSHKIILKGKSRKKISADKYRIGQVIINLITNAIKYSPDANKVIVSIENKRNEVLISVQDFGKGIEKENINKIFSPYFRESTVTHGKIPGLGLGLYISSEIVKRHNGKIWVKSTEGKGSTFYVSLPLR